MTKNNINFDNTNKVKINKKKSMKKKNKNGRVSLNRKLTNDGGNLPWWLQWLPVPSNNSGPWISNNYSNGWSWGNSDRGWGNSDRGWGNDNRYDRSYRGNDYGNNYSNRGTTYRISFDSDDDEY